MVSRRSFLGLVAAAPMGAPVGLAQPSTDAAAIPAAVPAP
jgi:hypothetical protein